MKNLNNKMAKAIASTIPAAEAGNTAAITSAIRAVALEAVKASKENVADTAAAINEAIGEAIHDTAAILALDTAAIDAIGKSALDVKETLANAKALALQAASAHVTYEGSWTLNARIEVIDDDLANATASGRYVDAKAALTTAGLTIPAAGAKRSEWRNLQDAATKAAGADATKADALRQAIACVRGAMEDVIAGAAGKVKCLAKPFGKAIARKVDGQDARILVLPTKKYYFYADAAKAPTSRQAAHVIEVILDEKGRLADKDAVTIK